MMVVDKRKQEIVDDNKIEQMIEKRIAMMEQADYTFPQKMAKKDYVIVALVCLICFVMLIVGAYL